VSQDIRELENSINKVWSLFNSFLKQLSYVASEINKSLTEVSQTIMEKDDDNIFASIFGGNKKDNNGYIIYDNNLLLTSLYEEVFYLSWKIKDEYDKKDFTEKLILSSQNQKNLKDKVILDNSFKLFIEEFLTELLKIEKPYIKMQNALRKKKVEKSKFTLEIESNDDEKIKSILETDSSEKIVWEIIDISSWVINDKNVFDITIDSYKWDEELCAIKKEAFQLIDNIFEKSNFHDVLNIDVENAVEAMEGIKSLISLKKAYDKKYDEKFGYKPKNKWEIWETRNSYHYVVEKDNHDKIVGLKKQDIDKAPQSIWKSIDIVKAKIKHLVESGDEIWYIRELFEGVDNSLDNILIIWPYGTWKTALIRELGYDDSIVTVGVQASDLASMWYGVTDQNPKLLFEFAAETHKETWKKVFIMIDEFDQMMNMSNSSQWNQSETIEKEMQIILDGVSAYKWVHLIGLTNEPRKVPAGIIRRMDSVITERLTQAEKVELIYSKFKQFSFDDDLTTYLNNISIDIADIDSSEFEVELIEWYMQKKHKENQNKWFWSLNEAEKRMLTLEFVTSGWLETSSIDIEQHSSLRGLKWLSNMPKSQEELLTRIFVSTPKILTSICQRSFDMMIKEKKSEIWTDKVRSINKKTSTYKTEKWKINYLKKQWFIITLKHLQFASEDIFKNPTIKQQIKTNVDFYVYLKLIWVN